MGWTDSHLRAFGAGGAEGGVPDPELRRGARAAAEATLRDVVEDTGARTIHHLRDFGDGWDHAIRIERTADPEPGRLHPRLMALQGRRPPEDAGGPRPAAPPSSWPSQTPPTRTTSICGHGPAAASTPTPPTPRPSSPPSPTPPSPRPPVPEAIKASFSASTASPTESE